MEEDVGVIMDLVRRAGRIGAASASSDRQVIADAVDAAEARCADAILCGKRVTSWESWAYATAANAARAIGAARGRHGSFSERGKSLSGDDKMVGARGISTKERESLRCAILAKRDRLIGRQLEVLLKVLEPDMSIRLAAKELSMDRRSLRRSFYTGMKRLMV